MYKRVLLKFSGETLQGEAGHGIEGKSLQKVAQQIVHLQSKGYEIAIVVGAGNIWRYRDNKEVQIERTLSDYMGMLGTVMNAVASAEAVRQAGASAEVFSAVHIPQLTTAYTKAAATHALEEGKIVFCAGGTGNPFFTTDSAAALRAVELDCDVIIKATKVDGVYDKDPTKHSDAVKYETLSFDEALQNNLAIMDSTAFSLCRDNEMPIIVLNMDEEGAVEKALKGEKIGTLVK